MTISEQFKTYIHQIETRRRSPAKGATLAAYNSYYRNHVNPLIGQLELSKVENGVMRGLVEKLSAANLSPTTINGICNLVKSIVASAVDLNGNQVCPRVWNSEFIDAPVVTPGNTPVMGRESLQEALGRTEGTFRHLCVLAAGSGARISELLALKTKNQLDSSYWDEEESKLVIKKALYRGVEQSTKTAAGVREVDLAPELNLYLKENIAHNGYMFGGEKPFRLRTAYDLSEKAGIPGFHSFRRSRITHLENVGVPRGLQMFWTGHAAKDVHETYIKLDRDIQARKEWAIKAGLGFDLPK